MWQGRLMGYQMKEVQLNTLPRSFCLLQGLLSLWGGVPGELMLAFVSPRGLQSVGFRGGEK